MTKPEGKDSKTWPKCSFFAIYDGHGGSNCKSGSCAIIVLTVETECYVANVGDSRAVMSTENGMRVYDLS